MGARESAAGWGRTQATKARPRGQATEFEVEAGNGVQVQRRGRGGRSPRRPRSRANQGEAEVSEKEDLESRWEADLHRHCLLVHPSCRRAGGARRTGNIWEVTTT